MARALTILTASRMRLSLVLVVLGAVACGGGGGSGGNNTPGDTDAGGDPGPTSGDTDPGGDSTPTACSLTVTCAVTRTFACYVGLNVFTSGDNAGQAQYDIGITPDDSPDAVQAGGRFTKEGQSESFLRIGGYDQSNFDVTHFEVDYGASDSWTEDTPGNVSDPAQGSFALSITDLGAKTTSESEVTYNHPHGNFSATLPPDTYSSPGTTGGCSVGATF